MTGTLDERLRRTISGRRISWLAFGCVACMAAFAARDVVTARNAISPPGNVLDKRLWYTPEEVDAYFTEIGPAGRKMYAITQFTLDLAFPVLYTALFMSLIARWCPPPLARRLVWVPLGIFVTDIAENSLLVYLAFHSAVAHPDVARTASLCTTIKWSLVGVCALGVLAGRIVMTRSGEDPRK